MKRHRRPKSKWLKISISHPRILSSHIDWHYFKRHFIPYQDEEIEDQGQRYSTHFKIKWWALRMAKHMHLRTQMNHLLNAFLKILLGWSEGSELSQLIVHSQLQIEFLVLLFPPSHYCTWLEKRKIIIKLFCSTLFPVLEGTIFLSQLLSRPQLCTASAPSVKSAARPGISSGKQPTSAWQMHML